MFKLNLYIVQKTANDRFFVSNLNFIVLNVEKIIQYLSF